MKRFLHHKPFTLLAALILSIGLGASAQAASYGPVNFPSTSLTVPGTATEGISNSGWFVSSTIDYAYDTFLGTGLTMVDQLVLDLDMTWITGTSPVPGGSHVDLDVFVNLLPVGTVSFFETAGASVISSTFNFAPIAGGGAGDEYNLFLLSTFNVPINGGSAQISLTNSFATLTDTTTPGGPGGSGNPVPEPGTIVLLGTGLVGLVGYRMKKAQA